MSGNSSSNESQSVKPWLYRYSVLVAICTFLEVVTGAWYTSLRSAPEAPSELTVNVHWTLGFAVIVLIIGFALWLMTAGFRWLGALTLVFAIADGFLGARAAPVSHAIVAHIVFALAASAAVCTSPAWQRGPELVFDQGWPSLRSLAVVTPVFVLAQASLGAAFRHKAMGLTWHIVGAMIVSIVVLMLGMFVMQQFPKHPALRPAAIALLSIVLAQVLLGIAAITTEMLAPGNTVPVSVMLSTAAHVTVGSLTLAASVVLGLQIRRNVQKAPEEPEENNDLPANT